MPTWGIAVGPDFTLRGTGYHCLLEDGVDAEAGDALCTVAPEGKAQGDAPDAKEGVAPEASCGAPQPEEDGGEAHTAERREAVRGMMRRAWSGYAAHSWGANELRPKSRRGNPGGIFGKSEMGATIVDGLDSLLLMGLASEAAEARRYIAEELNFDVDVSVSVFETMIRFVGGLLSSFALTRDRLYLDKASELCTRLLPAFQTRTGIPASTVNLRTGQRSHWKWVPGGGTNAILSEFGSIELEMLFLSDASGDPTFAAVAENTSAAIRRSLDMLEGGREALTPNFFDVESGVWGRRHTSLGPYGDSFYEYLLKRWVYRGGRDVPAVAALRQQFDATIRTVRQKLHRRDGAALFIADSQGGKVSNSMWHLACFAGGMYALGGATAANETEAGAYLADAKDITATCRGGYASQPTGLGPERMTFSGGAIGAAKEKEYILRPETAESFFYLWRTTHDSKYRAWAWEMVQAIETHCRCGVGYCGVKDVTASRVTHDDEQQSFFLAETLKYLYLIFGADSVLDLDRWVFNTEAHPFPIRGRLGTSWKE